MLPSAKASIGDVEGLAVASIIECRPDHRLCQQLGVSHLHNDAVGGSRAGISEWWASSLQKEA